MIEYAWMAAQSVGGNTAQVLSSAANDAFSMLLANRLYAIGAVFLLVFVWRMTRSR